MGPLLLSGTYIIKFASYTMLFHLCFLGDILNYRYKYDMIHDTPLLKNFSASPDKLLKRKWPSICTEKAWEPFFSKKFNPHQHWSKTSSDLPRKLSYTLIFFHVGLTCKALFHKWIFTKIILKKKILLVSIRSFFLMNHVRQLL